MIDLPDFNKAKVADQGTLRVDILNALRFLHPILEKMRASNSTAMTVVVPLPSDFANSEGKEIHCQVTVQLGLHPRVAQLNAGHEAFQSAIKPEKPNA